MLSWRRLAALAIVLTAAYVFYGLPDQPSVEGFETLVPAPIGLPMPIPAAVPVRVFTATQTALFVMDDADRYIGNFTQADLHARGVTSREVYKRAVQEVAVNATPDQRARLERVAAIAEGFLSDPQHRLPWLPREAQMPEWTFALTSGTTYEQGWPHTRGDAIFLSTNIFESHSTDALLAATIVHERVHVIQRRQPLEVHVALHAAGWVAVAPLDPDTRARRRANPDTDGRVYKDAEGRKHVALYRSMRPSSMSDIEPLAHSGDEHPFEAEAYRVQEAYTNTTNKS